MSSNSKLEITVLGGLGEIGMNCMAIETERDLVIVDCGVLFTDLEHFGVELAIPNFAPLLEKKDKLKAFLITHGHEDHIGALPFALRAGLKAPVYASPFTGRLIENKLYEFSLETTTDQRVWKWGEQLSFDELSVRSVPVNHSIVESSALIFETPLGKVIHTGDFKIDPNPYYGKELDLTEFKKAGDEGVHLLLSDSTNVEVESTSISESTIYDKFEEVFAAAQGLTIVSTFASNVARMGQVFEIARKQKKKVAVTGRSMESNLLAAQEFGYVDDAQKVLITLDELDNYRRDKLIVMSTGSQGEYRSALNRIASGEHKQIQLQEGDLIVMSSKFIPGNEIAISRVINQLFRQGAEVLYDAIDDVHVSGHAGRPELKRMIEAVRPRFFVPVHGEYRHLVHHAALARETGVKDDHAVVIGNGTRFTLSEEQIEVQEVWEELRILVETRELGELERSVLKERRKLGEMGCIFVLIARNEETGAIVSGPQIICKGVRSLDDEVQLIEKTTNLVKEVVREELVRSRGVAPEKDALAEEIRIRVRRMCNQRYGKKPVVVPLIMEL